MAHGHRDFSLSGSSAVFFRARVYIVAIQAECPTPSTPLTPQSAPWVLGEGVGQIDTQHPKPPQRPTENQVLTNAGCRGVEGVGYSACMTTICAFLGVKEVREVKGVKPNVLSPQVQLDLQSSWSEYKDL